jgi:hypothetical protein
MILNSKKGKDFPIKKSISGPHFDSHSSILKPDDTSYATTLKNDPVRDKSKKPMRFALPQLSKPHGFGWGFEKIHI